MKEYNTKPHKYDRYEDLTKISEKILNTVKPRVKDKQKNILDFIPKQPKQKITYSQDWKAYNKAQTQEKILFMVILDEILSYIKEKEHKGRGRPSYSHKDKVLSLCLQMYNNLSSRRCISDLTLAKNSRLISKVPHFNSVLNFYNDPNLIYLLKRLIQISGMPLKPFETQFAVDSSGFSTSAFERWFDVRIGKDSLKRKYKKCHIIVGTKTNIITSVEITSSYGSDSKQFPYLVKESNKYYDMKEISADKAYLARVNLQVTQDIGAIPFIPFKKNSRGRPKGPWIWRQMFTFFKENYPEFMTHYHRRSNVETSFSMIKQKFSHKLRCKRDISQTNEILVKCLCHNICVLIQEYFELNANLDFDYCADLLNAQK